MTNALQSNVAELRVSTLTKNINVKKNARVLVGDSTERWIKIIIIACSTDDTVYITIGVSFCVCVSYCFPIVEKVCIY